MFRCGRRAPSAFVPGVMAAARDAVGVEVEATEEGTSAVEVLVMVDVDVLLNRHSRDAERKSGVRERNTESMARGEEVVDSNSSRRLS